MKLQAEERVFAVSDCHNLAAAVRKIRPGGDHELVGQGLRLDYEAGSKAFTQARVLRILRGEVRAVIRGLRRLGSTTGLTGKAAKDLSRICGYLEKNADRRDCVSA